MQVLEAIRSRRAIHLGSYLDTPIAAEIVREVLDAGRWAPSGANNQPCHFVVVRQEAARRWVIEHMLEVLRLSGQVGRPPYRESLRTYAEYLAGQNPVPPPVMLITLAEQDKRETHVYNHGGLHILAASAAIQNMMLAAWSFGLGSTWLTFYDDVRVKARFGIPTELDVVGIVLLAYPRAVPRVPPSMYGFGFRARRPLEEMLHEERFDEAKLAALRRRDPFLHWIPEDERARLVAEENQRAQAQRRAAGGNP